MKLGIIGLGRMGSGVAERVLKAGHEVVGFDLDQVNKQAAQAIGVEVVMLWLMLRLIVTLYGLWCHQGMLLIK